MWFKIYKKTHFPSGKSCVVDGFVRKHTNVIIIHFYRLLKQTDVHLEPESMLLNFNVKKKPK